MVSSWRGGHVQQRRPRAGGSSSSRFTKWPSRPGRPAAESSADQRVDDRAHCRPPPRASRSGEPGHEEQRAENAGERRRERAAWSGRPCRRRAPGPPRCGTAAPGAAPRRSQRRPKPASATGCAGDASQGAEEGGQDPVQVSDQGPEEPAVGGPSAPRIGPSRPRRARRQRARPVEWVGERDGRGQQPDPVRRRGRCRGRTGEAAGAGARPSRRRGGTRAG